MSKKMKDKVKRKHFNWYEFLLNTGDLEWSASFWKFKQLHKTMSNNRCAYNILKTYYSTTSMRYIREFGELPPVGFLRKL